MPTRKIDTQIARSSAFKEMPIRVRYFWFYLLTTDFSKTIGIFHLPLEIVASETNLDIAEVKQYLMTLTDLKLLIYSPESSEVIIFNYPKYNIFGWNDYMKTQIDNELSTIKNPNLIKIMVSYLQNYILVRPNDKRSYYLQKVLYRCERALKPYINKEEDIDKDKDIDKDVDEDKENKNELNIKISENFEETNWDELVKLAKNNSWLKEN